MHLSEGGIKAPKEANLFGEVTFKKLERYADVSERPGLRAESSGGAVTSCRYVGYMGLYLCSISTLLAPLSVCWRVVSTVSFADVSWRSISERVLC